MSERNLTSMFQYAVESHRTSVGEANKTHPGTVVPPGSNRRDGGGNEAIQVLRYKRLSYAPQLDGLPRTLTLMQGK